MSEINGPKFSVNQVNYSGIQKQNSEQPIIENSETTPQLTDFSDSKAEALGRSMLFKGVDDVNNDLKALMEKTDVIILDEPFNGIEEESVTKIKKILKLLKKEGKLIFISSHINEDLDNLADKIYLIDNGEFNEK